MDLISPPLSMMFGINAGKGSARKVLPVVSSTISPLARSQETVSPAAIAATASGHSRMGSPMLMELR